MALQLYSENHDDTIKKEFTISVLSENKSGLLNAVTIIFTRRKINIENINVSETEIEGVSRYHIVVNTTRARVEKVVKQIRKIVEVLGAFVYEEDDIHYQEIALYKVPTEIFLGGNKIETIVRANNARILVIEKDYIVIEKTGHKDETKRLFELLKPHGLLEYVRSGRITISKSRRKTETFLEQLEEASLNKINYN